MSTRPDFGITRTRAAQAMLRKGAGKRVGGRSVGKSAVRLLAFMPTLPAPAAIDLLEIKSLYNN